ncbi:uncharacterized protein LOC143176843, partial [Nomia melanderi]|uniref:uncharacterized protein LOC143176843 n=1 Tax=Nomia melanderi TaxID=2448451 RepID=UPI003FCDF965
MANPQESTQLKGLKRQRRSIKGQLTRIENYVNEGVHSNIHEFQVRKERVNELFRIFDGVQSNIELEDEVSDHELEREQFERSYFKIISAINGHIEGLQSSGTSTNPLRATDSPSTITVRQEGALLPKIEIKPYNGDPIEWHSFHDTFKTLVHDNPDLPAVQKFHLLKNALRGEIVSVISALNASEPNYLVAWDLLQKRCNKPRQIVHAHLKALFELAEVTRETPANLRFLAEQAQMHAKALETIGLPVMQWDAILVYLIGKKLDKNTRRGWERTLEDDEMPTFEQLLKFINKQARGEELDRDFSTTSRRNIHQERSQGARINSRGQTFLATTKARDCVMCKDSHEIYQCKHFLQATIRDRLELIKRNKLCLNCFRANHMAINCQASGCKRCNQKHNTLLHFDKEQRPNVPQAGIQIGQTTMPGTSATALTVTYNSEVLLGTAKIKILDRFNREHDCRVLLDGGSQTHFITEELAEKLQLRKQAMNVTLSGLGEQATRAQYIVRTTVKARGNPFSTQVSFVTLPSITGLLPSRQVNRSNLQLPQNIQLADPDFHKPGKIDALLGNVLFFKLLSSGQIKLNNDRIILQKTRLGWIVTGESSIQAPYIAPTSVKAFYASLDKTLNKFWEVEQFTERKYFSAEERVAEGIFKDTTERDVDGRYCVRLPFNERRQILGSSREIALRRFYALERKIHLDKGLLKGYTEFLREYEQLGHMTQVNANEAADGFYLPHHAVIKEASETTRVRVVFDASAKTSTGISLNDTLLNRPQLQQSLYKIFRRFRSHTYVLTADIDKMIRQIRLHPEDRIYQRILWRESPDKPIRTFQLNTVTYGTTSAPFLAVRCLQQLADNERDKFPIAVGIFKRDFYMDDLITGVETRELALKLRNQAIGLARLGGFNLRQWTSNDEFLVKGLELGNHECTISLDINETRKALGISWKTQTDEIMYTIKTTGDVRPTKRSILSQIAQLFDPLGLLGPVIVRAKIIMQELWKAHLSWDESVPQSLETMWIDFKRELPQLNEFVIPRATVLKHSVAIQLLGFADASEAAYGACLYLRSVNKEGGCNASLVCAKSRIAPVKTISLPRLELCAAKLLADLTKETIEALSHLKIEKVLLWSDSTVTLHWIKTPPHTLKTFIANRVSEIQRQTEIHNWYHIASLENPADYISRGQTPTQLLNNQQWLKGPHWLSQAEETWPFVKLPVIEIPERREFKTLMATIDTSEFVNRFSSIKCVNCFRANPKLPAYVMGNLPKDRVTQARPFENA